VSVPGLQQIHEDLLSHSLIWDNIEPNQERFRPIWDLLLPVTHYVFLPDDILLPSFEFIVA
jgi:hypothetical protein